MKLSDIPMMHRRVPFDDYHAMILTALQTGKVTRAESAAYFDMPGIGFHRSMWMLTLHLVEHKKYGQQSFIIPEVMQDALVRTSLAGVTVDDLRMPYPSIYMALPGNTRSIWGGRETLWHEVRGIFAWHEKGDRELLRPGEDPVAPENDRGLIHLYLWGIENERSKHRGDDASLWVALDLNEMHASGEDLEAYLARILRDRNRETKDHMLQDNPELADALGFTFLPKTDESFNKQAEGVIDTLRILFNALLYMDSDGAELERDPDNLADHAERESLRKQLARKKNPKKKGRRIIKRFYEIPTDTVTWVGRSFGYSTPERSGGGKGTGTGTPQRVHWVRGHWWPRRDTIQRRIAELESKHKAVVQEYHDLRTAVANAPEAEDTSEHLMRLAFARGKALKADEEIKDLTTRLEAKRRWVKPYRKGSRGSEPESHTYVLGKGDA